MGVLSKGEPGYPVRRRHPRHQVHDVRGTFPLQFEVAVLNMSLTGLAVESRRPLEVGREYELTLQTGREEVHLKAEVQWDHLVRTERSGSEVFPVYQSGLDFRSVLDDKAQELLAFLQQNITIDADRRIFGRFRVILEGPTSVTEYHDFSVHVISLSGMLIETRELVDVGSALDMELHAGHRRLEMVGRVANRQLIRKFPEEGVCRAGIAFEGLDKKTGRALKKVITDFLAE